MDISMKEKYAELIPQLMSELYKLKQEAGDYK